MNRDDDEFLDGWSEYLQKFVLEEDISGMDWTTLVEIQKYLSITRKQIRLGKGNLEPMTFVGIPHIIPLERNNSITLPQRHHLYHTPLFNKLICLGFVHPKWMRMEKRWWTKGRDSNGMPFIINESIPAFESQPREDGMVFTALYTRNFVLANLSYDRINECVKFIYDPKLDSENEYSSVWDWDVSGVYCLYDDGVVLDSESRKQLQEDFHDFVLNKAATTIQKFYRKYSLRTKFKHKVLPSVECLATFRYRNEEKVDPETLKWWKEFELEQVRELFSEVWE